LGRLDTEETSPGAERERERERERD
jgi:hypothetical protein